MIDGRSEEERISTAIHEAGHVVMMLLLGHSFDYVTIEPEEHASGCVHGGEKQVVPTDKPVIELLCEASIILCAGELAQRRACGNDEIGIMTYPVEATDGAKLDHLLDGFSPVVRQELIDVVLTIPVLFFMQPAIWRTVEAVRDALLVHTTLAYVQVAAIGDELLTDALRDDVKRVLDLAAEEVYGTFERNLPPIPSSPPPARSNLKPARDGPEQSGPQPPWVGSARPCLCHNRPQPRMTIKFARERQEQAVHTDHS